MRGREIGIRGGRWVQSRPTCCRTLDGCPHPCRHHCLGGDSPEGHLKEGALREQGMGVRVISHEWLPPASQNCLVPRYFIPFAAEKPLQPPR